MEEGVEGLGLGGVGMGEVGFGGVLWELGGEEQKRREEELEQKENQCSKRIHTDSPAPLGRRLSLLGLSFQLPSFSKWCCER